jgi:ABC-2 type transport system ATP-binding protein
VDEALCTATSLQPHGNSLKALHIEALTKVYDGDVEALRGIDLSVDEGNFFALLGPNGAGKSTAIGIIASLVNKTSGRVSVCGHDLDTEKEAAKANIGLVPQEFNFSVFESVESIVMNVAGYNGLPRRLAKQRTEHYLKQLSLWDKRKVAARDLSGGMKRRLMIARALVHEPKLLILDEPTAGVDIEIRRAMWEFLTRINKEQGTTIILTTHYLEEAESLCRDVAIIDQGIIVEQGTVSELLSRSMMETFVLDVQKPVQTTSIGPYSVRTRDDGKIEIDVPQGTALNDVFSELTSNGISVSSLRNKENRLEAFFLRLVNSQRETAAANAQANDHSLSVAK